MNSLVAELRIELDRKPVVIDSVVVDEEFLAHLFEDERAEYRILIAFHCGYERTAVFIGYVKVFYTLASNGLWSDVVKFFLELTVIHLARNVAHEKI